jgi:hypothetical protein
MYDCIDGVAARDWVGPQPAVPDSVPVNSRYVNMPMMLVTIVNELRQA